MSTRRLLEAFDRWRVARIPLVLVTVVETEGSTYTKPGHRILMTGTGEYQGLVSGGCLEGDLADHARDVLACGEPKLVTYDLRGETDELWGMGIGCDGLFRVLLQPLSAVGNYQPFHAMAAGFEGESDKVAAIVVDSQDPAVAPGATVIVDKETTSAWLVAGKWQDQLIARCRSRMHAARAEIIDEKRDGATLRVLYTPLRPLPRLLVLGAGLDAVPLVEIARRLGWRVSVVDHRPANLARGDLGLADVAHETSPGEIGIRLRLDGFAAAIVMSHHLASDREYLRALANSEIPYIGLLGPPARRDRLLAELGADAAPLRPRLHAPAGLHLGADSPESIALAILAEIHATLAGRADAAAETR